MKTNLQNKWRLPTIWEFDEVLYSNKDDIPNLKKNYAYWSSSESNYIGAWSFYFGIGLANYSDDKYSTNQVRAVRDISSDSPNSSNSTIIGNLEIYNKDLGRMSWNEALAAVEKLNNNKKH
jgi:hypothetical protein